eukprot:GEMP01029008.1.p1 GENE.GEMP01029008.1~~GEMP01029008.1.p1  ORF type:complete len:507 (+),score=112.82 GEMP01029008.1:49-1569(+)
MSVAARLRAFSKSPSSPSHFLALVQECHLKPSLADQWAIPLVQCVQCMATLTSAQHKKRIENAPSPAFWQQAADALQPLMPHLPLRQLGIIANAFAQVHGRTTTAFMPALARHVASRFRGEEISARDAAHLLNAWAKTRVAPHMPQLLEGMDVNSASPQAVACILHGATRLHLEEHTFVQDRFIDRVKVLAADGTGEWKPQELCMAVWSYAHMAHPRARNVVSYLANPCASVIEHLPEVEVVMIVTAFGKAGLFPARVTDELDKILNDNFVRDMRESNFAILCNALTKWPVGLAMRVLLRAGRHRTNWHNFAPQHAGFVLQAYAKLGLREEKVFDLILNRLAIESLPPMNGAHVIVALAKADIIRPAEPFYRFVTRRCADFTDASLVGLLYSWLHWHYFAPGPISQLLLEAHRRGIDSASFSLQSSVAVRCFHFEMPAARCSLNLLRALERINTLSTKWQNHSNFFDIRHSNFQQEVEQALPPCSFTCIREARALPFQIDLLLVPT